MMRERWESQVFIQRGGIKEREERLFHRLVWAFFYLSYFLILSLSFLGSKCIRAYVEIKVQEDEGGRSVLCGVAGRAERQIEASERRWGNTTMYHSRQGVIHTSTR